MQIFAQGWTTSKQTQQGTVVTAIENGSVDSMNIVEAPLGLTPRLVRQALRLPPGLHSKSAAVLNHKVWSRWNAFSCAITVYIQTGFAMSRKPVSVQAQASNLHHIEC